MAAPIKLDKSADRIQQSDRTGTLDPRHRPPTPIFSSDKNDTIDVSEIATTSPTFPNPLLIQKEAALMNQLRLALDERNKRPPEEIIYSRKFDQSDSSSQLGSPRASSAPAASPINRNEDQPVPPLRRSRTSDSSPTPSSITPSVYPTDPSEHEQFSVLASPLFHSLTDHPNDQTQKEESSTSITPRFRPRTDFFSSFPSILPFPSKVHGPVQEFEETPGSPRSSTDSGLRHVLASSTSTSTPRTTVTSPASIPHPSLSMVYGNYSTLNPLRTLDVVLDPNELRKRCPTLMKITDKKKFDAQTAAMEITQCLALSHGPELLSETLFRLKGELDGTKRKPRFNELMACLMLFPQAVVFTSAFVRAHEDPDEFSKSVIVLLKSRDATPLSIIYSLSLFTKNEMDGETLKTLFRGTTLSSSLCKEYGHQLLDPELRPLGRFVKRTLDRNGLLNFCLSEKLLHKHLIGSETPGSSSDPSSSNAIVTERLQKNILFCKTYFREILNEVYHMKIPPECQSLLAMRRAQIAKQFSLPQTDEQLVAFAGQLLFLRILNPSLISEGSSELEVSALVSLTKITQALANQNPFGSEKQDPIFESFNDLYEEFKIVHQQFINANSL